jgi:hypothetical protein
MKSIGKSWKPDRKKKDTFKLGVPVEMTERQRFAFQRDARRLLACRWYRTMMVGTP